MTSTRSAVRSLRPRIAAMLASGGAIAHYATAATLLCVIAAGMLYGQENTERLFHQAVRYPDSGHRLAMLPLTLVDSDADAGYLADGMTQELITQLSRIGGLRIIARSSVMRIQGSGKNATEIGRELAVETVLCGSVQPECGQLQITMHLVDAKKAGSSSGRSTTPHLSLNSKDSSRRSCYTSPKCFVCRCTGPEQRQLARFGTSSAEAYLLYLKGGRFLDKRND